MFGQAKSVQTPSSSLKCVSPFGIDCTSAAVNGLGVWSREYVRILNMLVLASKSPRRRALLDLAGWPYRLASPVELDESILPGESPRQYVLRLAQLKALASTAGASPGDLVLGADTTVVLQDEILGKPADADEAKAMLRRLRGQVHQVYTALALIRAGVPDQPLIDLCVTDVTMRAYSDEELDDYVASGDPLDKAGGYAIQHTGFAPVERIAGCYANVVGLPLCHLTRLLCQLGIPPAPDLPYTCQAKFDYECAVEQVVLN